ncbi:MAG: TIGR04283 family arsenosugar biosynthesis glycosyltransferase [Gammaproteobacteria bacterium]
MKVSVIIPVLNEASGIATTLERLQESRTKGHEVIVVDGGSTDGTSEQARPLADLVLTSLSGRARQMNTGACAASGEALWFLHADTLAPVDAIDNISTALADGHRCWGRFDVQLSGSSWPFRIIEHAMNLRSCLTRIATGDQGIFVTREAFERVTGFSEIPLMEDIELCKDLRQQSRPACLGTRLVTSSRRWEQHGIMRTVLLMWRLRLAYYLGASPESLAERYRRG